MGQCFKDVGLLYLSEN